MAGELQVTVEPWGPSPDAVAATARSAVQAAAVRAALDGGDARMVAVQPVEVGSGVERPEAVHPPAGDAQFQHAQVRQPAAAEVRQRTGAANAAVGQDQPGRRATYWPRERGRVTAPLSEEP